VVGVDGGEPQRLPLGTRRQRGDKVSTTSSCPVWTARARGSVAEPVQPMPVFVERFV